VLNGARDALAVLRSKTQRPEYQQIKGALQQLEPIAVLLGRHLT
jgi:hypothetical protein